jgi:hypothetical protein
LVNAGLTAVVTEAFALRNHLLSASISKYPATFLAADLHYSLPQFDWVNKKKRQPVQLTRLDAPLARKMELSDGGVRLWAMCHLQIAALRSFVDIPSSPGMVSRALTCLDGAR